MIEQLVDDPEELTTADVNAWLEGADDEQFQYMTDDEIIVAVQDSDDEEGEGSGASADAATTQSHTVNTDSALRAYATAITWAEENGASAFQLMTLKTLEENVLKTSFNSKKQKSITNYFSVI